MELVFQGTQPHCRYAITKTAMVAWTPAHRELFGYFLVASLHQITCVAISDPTQVVLIYPAAALDPVKDAGALEMLTTLGFVLQAPTVTH